MWPANEVFLHFDQVGSLIWLRGASLRIAVVYWMVVGLEILQISVFHGQNGKNLFDYPKDLGLPSTSRCSILSKRKKIW